MGVYRKTDPKVGRILFYSFISAIFKVRFNNFLLFTPPNLNGLMDNTSPAIQHIRKIKRFRLGSTEKRIRKSAEYYFTLLFQPSLKSDLTDFRLFTPPNLNGLMNYTSPAINDIRKIKIFRWESTEKPIRNSAENSFTLFLKSDLTTSGYLPLPISTD